MSHLDKMPDDVLKSLRKEAQAHLRAIENEIRRRREEKFRAPLWWCTPCQHSFYKIDNICDDCGNECYPFNQAAMALDILEEERNG